MSVLAGGRVGGPGRHVIGVVVHPTRPVRDSLVRLRRWATQHETTVLGRASDRHLLGAAEDDASPDVHAVTDAEFTARAEAVVSLGGDGTMLGAMRLVSERPVPVLGVNHGNLGFLVELTPDGLDDALAQLVEGRFTVEPHAGLLVEGDLPAATPLDPRVAFNDVVLRGRGASWGVSVDLEINGERYGYYRADALVVSTPTGSTAYNYAAGGPVLSPSVAAVVVTPVAPASGIARPVVFAATDVVSLRVNDSSGAVGSGIDGPVAVDVDGVPAGSVTRGHAVTTRPLAEPAQVVRLDTGAHERRSRVKLSLLDLPLRPDQLRELVPPDLRRHLEDRPPW